MHILTEGKRVLEFRDLCNQENISDTVKIEKMGKLMTESHFSSKNNYDSSNDKLNELT